MSNDLFDEMESDSNELPSEKNLGKISTLYQKMSNVLQIISQLEARLSFEKECLKKITDYELPSAMAEAGCKKFTTEDGFTLEIKPFYTAKISDENREKCFEWLKNNHLDGLIKHQISTSFNRQEGELAKKVVEILDSIGVSYTDKESVHPQTLNAFVKERIEAGKDIPQTMFGVYIGQTTKIRK